MTHPLTDKICHEIAESPGASKYRAEYTHYFLKDYMRAAADWQLEQVIEQWEEVINSNKTDIQVIREFDKRLQTMRPQEDSD